MATEGSRNGSGEAASGAAQGIWGGAGADPILLNQMGRALERLVGNAYTSRESLLQKLLDPRREIATECGYPKEDAYISPEFYQQLYDRESVAARVVECFPRETWQTHPEVYESEDPDQATPFEEALADLNETIRGERSWYAGEGSHCLWMDYLRRADELSGIGHFGIVLLGIDDGQPLGAPAAGVFNSQAQERPRFARSLRRVVASEEGAGEVGIKVEKVPLPKPTLNELLGTDAQYFGYTAAPPEGVGASPADSREAQAYLGKMAEDVEAKAPPGPRRLVFLRAFPEHLVQIVQYESNMASPRFGKPVRYLVTLNDPQEEMSGIGLPVASIYVHWSRIIHVADTHHTATSSEVFAVPRQRPVLNRILDLRKLYSGSAEMYWRGAFPGLSLETHPTLGGDVDINAASLRSMMSNYMNGLQRYLALSGMSAKSLAPQVVDPGMQVDKQLDAICIKIAIPKRIFLGSERGELSSGQDDSTWNDRKSERQLNYLTPRIIVPFLDRLITIGVLPPPGTVRPPARAEVVALGPLPLTPPDSNLPSVEALAKAQGQGQQRLSPSLAQPAVMAPPAPGHNASQAARARFGITLNRRGLLVVPVMERKFLINAAGDVVGEQGKGYSVVWPDLSTTTEEEIAKVAESRTRALVQYVTGGVETMVPPLHYLTEFLKMEEAEALAMLTKAAQDLESDSIGDETGGSRLLGFAGGVQAVLQMFQMFSQGAISRETLRQLIMLFYKVGAEKADRIISTSGDKPPGQAAAEYAAYQAQAGAPGQPAPQAPGSPAPGAVASVSSPIGVSGEVPAYGDANPTGRRGL